MLKLQKEYCDRPSNFRYFLQFQMDRLFLQREWLVEQFLAYDQDLLDGPASIKTRVQYNNFSVLQMIWIYKNEPASCKGDGHLQHFLANHPFKSPPLVRRTVHLGEYFFKPARILPGFDGEVSSKMGSRRVTMTSCWERKRGGGRQAASLSKFFTPYKCTV